MALATARSTQDLINQAADTKGIQEQLDFWKHLQHVQFHERYFTAMIEAGIDQGKAAEVMQMMRHYIAKIVEGLDSATYLMREVVAEALDVQGRARNANTQSRFKI